MKKFFKILLALLAVVVLAGVAVYAAEARKSISLTFDGTIALCSCEVSALGQPLRVRMELLKGEEVVATWNEEGNGRVFIGQCSFPCVMGEIYTLRVSGMVGSAQLDPLETRQMCMGVLDANPFYHGDNAEEAVAALLAQQQEERVAQAAVRCANIIYGSFPFDKDGMTIYPEGFAGTCVEGEYLYIWIKDLSAEREAYYRHLVRENDKYLRFVNAAYDYRELYEIMQALTEKLQEEGLTIYSAWVGNKGDGIYLTTAEESVAAVRDFAAQHFTDIPVSVEPGSPVVLT